jgi:hypothetical protein
MGASANATNGERGRGALWTFGAREQRIDEHRLVAARVFDAKQTRLDGKLR